MLQLFGNSILSSCGCSSGLPMPQCTALKAFLPSFGLVTHSNRSSLTGSVGLSKSPLDTALQKSLAGDEEFTKKFVGNRGVLLKENKLPLLCLG